MGAWQIRRPQTETGVHTNLPRFGPPEGKDLYPACLILYCLHSWSYYNGAQMGSGYGRKRDVACASLCVGSMRDQVSMRDWRSPLLGRPSLPIYGGRGLGIRSKSVTGVCEP
jgi:hypothetical protein